MAKSLLMKFKTTDNKSYSLKVNRVKKDVAEEDVKNLMDSLVNNDVVIASGGALKVKESAEIITTTSEELDVE
ncbi:MULTISPECIES: DUF2922 domain-containing protein [Clostridium]|uniref:DUF2922 domain-containing protein n=1 Tax=Clostridium novyi B str. ATCC 27606 TaxID=1443123 RepID=A0AA40M4J8_CLONO|nr:MULTISPECIES: DUF2922 domain-containing protein [Clostridium]KEI07967.1 hypothetical protein Z958_p0154 [Clostridium novyi B str. NCTC 9691]KEI11405.1 hypothetical protein Z959_p0108 [Clostridium novyi B str. ATCC 27606]OOB74968.1 hypothetical protein AXF41_13720 [Clostridium haemolyticum]